ncbi:hypothetical protein PRK78_000549 [Emydomyces testavorans]|uniref:Mitochondrial carrier protein n=1 Tax=Emydomyces testavorans TaxID=2070801 RepID=A0AAF0IFZ3_9EURO|nr:hypothetical protein PRK78_000549 [Emydomyces testavorans]
MENFKPDQLSQSLPLQNIKASPRPNDLKLVKDATTKSWAHLVAGACGGMATAAITSPLDVLRTRLQTDFYRTHTSSGLVSRGSLPSSAVSFHTSLHHVRDTLQILSSIRHIEGWRGLFRGLGPSLTGVVPASAIKFYTYGNCKRLICETTAWAPDAAIVHVISASTAGIATAIATNPIWLVKMRLQLDKSRVGNAGRKYRNSLHCAVQVLRQEGFRGLYRGLSASFLGAAETTFHLALYEQLKLLFARGGQTTDHDGRYKASSHQTQDWIGVSAAAGLSKLLAALVAYPHEVPTMPHYSLCSHSLIFHPNQVVRTRLRQAPMENGSLKYPGLFQCFRLIWKEGRFASLYGGLTPHLLRAVPSAAITLGVYELVLRLLGEPT